MSKKILVAQSDAWACGYYRCVLPVEMLSQELEEEGIELVLREEFDNEFLSGVDVVVVSRCPTRPFLAKLADMKKKGVKIVAQFDDDLWNLMPGNPSKLAIDLEMDVINAFLALADVVAVSTFFLAQALPLKKSNVWVLPNLVDLEEYGESDWTDREKVRIVWSGSRHHYEDLLLLVEPLTRLLERREDVEVVFFGDMPEPMSDWLGGVRRKPTAVYGEKVHFVEPVAMKDYVPALQTIAADIALCPLAEHPFNDCKSANKFVEHTLTGSACVCSDSVPYADAVVKAGDWLSTLELLVDDKELRRRVSLADCATVLGKYTWQSQYRDAWLDFFRSL